MAAGTLTETPTLNDPEILRQINELRRIDNVTNWFYLAREYLFLAAVIGVTSTLYYQYWDGLWSLLWAVPLTCVCHLCVGAGQHRLASYAHEAAHYVLFKNRLVNELASEWLCMFPILGTTHPYRVAHIGHHQYPNDPDLDPDWAQLRMSGHRFNFPMSAPQFLWHCFFKQILWVPCLLRYILVRAVFRVDTPTGPYHMRRVPTAHLKVIGLFYHVGLAAVLAACVWWELVELLYLLPVLFGLAIVLIVTFGPAAWFPEYTVKADISERTRTGMRFTFNTLLLTGLGWTTYWTGLPIWLFYYFCWLSPLGTAFPFFMILRQVVQHGNADRARFTNTRIFLVSPLIRLSVFPIGNDYHLPHHLFMMVPHYNLAKLHDVLMQTQPYRDQATVVTGYFFHDSEVPPHPTVVDLMTHEMKEPAKV